MGSGDVLMRIEMRQAFKLYRSISIIMANKLLLMLSRIDSAPYKSF